MKRAYLILALVGLLAGCGSRQTLRPAEGHTLPPRPAIAATTPNANQLLTADVQQRPQRSEELLTQSVVRSEDRFDLPPQQ